MRDQNGDGLVDHPEYDVWDAYEIYQEMMGIESIPVNTDRVRHSWKGDWNHFNNGATGAVYYTEDSHYVWIPNGTERLEATFAATEFELETAQAGQLQLSIDLGEDGSNDGQGQGTRVADTWYYDLDVDSSAWGKWAHFDVTGQAITLFGVIEDPEFFETRIPYTVDVMLTLNLNEPIDISFEQRPDFYSDLDPAPPSDMYDSEMDGRLTFTRLVYDQASVVALIKPKVTSGDEENQGFFSSLGDLYSDYPLAMFILTFLVIAAVIGAGVALMQSNKSNEFSTDDSEVLEAEIHDDSDNDD